MRTTTAATLCALVGMMPAFLVGASAVFVREDLEFGRAGLGLAITAFFAGWALFSIPGGRISETLGASRALRLAAIGSSAALLTVGVVARNLAQLLLLLLLAGCFNSIAQTAANLAIARTATARPAFLFGIKQSATPAATLVAGASIPLISLTLGWRWAFALGAGLCLAAAASVPTRLAHGVPLRRARDGDAATGPLVALSLATGLGFASSTSLGAFLVETAVEAGVGADTGGWLLVVGSAVGILARLVVGWVTDRRHGHELATVASMLIVGAGGYGMVALGRPTLLTLGTLLAFAGGWGWPGLLYFAVVRLNPNAPAAATGIVQSGAASGAALGPVLFGTVTTAWSFGAAWALTAASAAASATLVLASQLWIRRADPPRPPTVRSAP